MIISTVPMVSGPATRKTYGGGGGWWWWWEGEREGGGGGAGVVLSQRSVTVFRYAC